MFKKREKTRKSYLHLCLKIKRLIYPMTQTGNRRQYGFIGKIVLPKEKNLEDVWVKNGHFIVCPQDLKFRVMK